MSFEPPTSTRGQDYAPSALPSPAARALAFGAIILSGLCGGIIGYALVTLQYDSQAMAGLAALGGAVISAGGVAIVSTLALRAMTEWNATSAAGTADEADTSGTSGGSPETPAAGSDDS